MRNINSEVQAIVVADKTRCSSIRRAPSLNTSRKGAAKGLKYVDPTRLWNRPANVMIH